MFSTYSGIQNGREYGWLFEQPPQEDNTVNSAVEAGWLGALLILGTIITLSLWLLNKLFPRVTAVHPDRNSTHRTNVPGASETQHGGSLKQHR